MSPAAASEMQSARDPGPPEVPQGPVAEKKVPAARQDGGSEAPSLDGSLAAEPPAATAKPQAMAAAPATSGKPTPPAAPPAASPRAAAKAPLELSSGGKALAEAIAQAKIGLDEPRPDSFGNPIYDVAPEKLVDAGRALRDKLGITYLSCLAPVDWPDRWEVVTHLYDFTHRTWVGLKTSIPKERLQVPSVASVWPAANWYEREGYDMYGIEFEGHPHLCRILMADDWPTFPLRKDHPMDVEGGY